MKFDLLVQQISQTHLHFQGQAAKAINVALTLRNWLIGCYIVEFEQNGEDRAAYGTGLLAKLALQCKFMKGLDERTFRNFRQFYLQYPHFQPIVAGHLTQMPNRWLLTSESLSDNKTGMPSIRGSVTPEFQSSENQDIDIVGTVSPLLNQDQKMGSTTRQIQNYQYKNALCKSLFTPCLEHQKQGALFTFQRTSFGSLETYHGECPHQRHIH